MDDANQAITALLGTATADPASGNQQSNPALKQIATYGKMINQQLASLTQAVSDLTATWGG